MTRNFFFIPAAVRALNHGALALALGASMLMLACPPTPEGPGNDDDNDGPAALALSPTVQGFGSVLSGEVSADFAFTVTNAGGAVSGAVTPTVTGPFVLTLNDCVAPLESEETCTINVKFSPTTLGTATGSLNVSANPGGTAIASLNGTGVGGGVITIDNTPANFGNVLVGASSDAQTFTVLNSGGDATGALSVVIGGSAGTQFLVATDECSDVELAGAASCVITVTFDPTSAGIAAATLTVTGTPGGTVVAALNGTGLDDANLSIAPNQRNFGSVTLGSVGTALGFTLTNTGDIATGTLGEEIGGTDGAQFVVTASGCAGAVLAPDASCTIDVEFQPSGIVAGAREAELVVTADPGNTATATLSGTAQALGQVEADPTAVDFGNVIVDTTSPSTTITIENTGGSATGPLNATLSGASSGEFLLVGGGNGCQGIALAAGATCTIAVSFQPSTSGDKEAQLTVSGTPGGTAVSVLSGAGKNDATLTLTPDTQDFGSVATNAVSASVGITVRNTGDVTTGAITAELGGAGAAQFDIVANGCTAPLAPTATCLITLSYSPVVEASHAALLNVSASPGGAKSAQLNGVGVSGADITVAPTVQGYGSFIIGQTADQSFTVRNNGATTTGPIVLSVIGADATQWGVETENCTTLVEDATCTVTVRFAPTTTSPAAAKAASLQIAATPGGTITAALTGTAVEKLSVTAPAVLPLDFGSVVIGNQSGLLTFTFTQTAGGAASGALTTTLAFGSPVQFALGADGCAGQSLAAGSSCNITARYTPSGNLGTATGSITVANAGTASSATATMTGTALGALSVDVPSHDYLGQVLTTASANFTYTFANTALVATGTLSTALVGGADFFITDDNFAGTALIANNGVAGGADECTVIARFAPSALGARTGSITVSGNPGNSAQTTLLGTGQTPAQLALNPATQNYGSVQAAVNNVVNNRTFTVSNSGQQTTSAITFLPLAGADAAQYEIRPLDEGTTCVSGTTTLTATQTCAIAVRFRPLANSHSATAKAATLNVTAVTGGADSTALSGISTSQLSSNPATLSFGNDVIDATATAPLSIVITNNGALTTSALTNSVTAEFTIAGGSNCNGVAVLPGASCTVNVTLNATAPVGAKSGTLTVAGVANDVSIAVAMPYVAQAQAQLANMNPASKDFGTVLNGASSDARTFTVTNTGGVATSALTAAIVEDNGAENDTPHFAIVTNGCTGTLAANASCSVSVRFAPLLAGGVGVKDANLSVSATTGGTALGAVLGKGVANGSVTVTPTPVDFADTVVNATSTPTTFTVTNTSAAASALLTYTASASFALAAGGTCVQGASIAAGGTCTQQVAFAPTAAGAVSGTFTITGTGVDTSAVLAGTGLVPSTININPTTFAFADTGFGSSSASSTFTVTNTGQLATGTVSAPVLAGTDPTQFAVSANTCTGTLDPAEACTFAVTFNPANVAARSATVTVNIAGATPPSVSATLSGSGVNPATITVAPSVAQAFNATAVGANGNNITFTLANDSLAASSGPLAFSLTNETDYDIVGGDCTQGFVLTGSGATQDCTVIVRFNPTGAPGTKAGALTATASPGGTVSVSMSGTATAALSVVTTTAFPANTTVGTQSQSVITVTNNSLVTTGIISVVLGGADANQFAIVDDLCAGNTRASGQTCTITVGFVPTTTGQKAGSVTVSASPGDTATVTFTPNAN
jgi:hypothetical protein